MYILLNSSYKWGAVSTTLEPVIQQGRPYSLLISGPSLSRSSTSRGGSGHVLRSSSEGVAAGHHSLPSGTPPGSRTVPSDVLSGSEDEERTPAVDAALASVGFFGDAQVSEEAPRHRLLAATNRIVIVAPGARAHVEGASGSASSLAVDAIDARIEADMRVARSFTRGRFNPLAVDESELRLVLRAIDRKRDLVIPPKLGVPESGEDPEPYLSETFSGRGKVVLKRLMGQGEASTVFTVVESPDIVVKYQSDCPAASLHHSHHPLVLDYYFHKKVESLGISPRVEAISPIEFMPRNPGMKCQFGMSKENYEKCVARGLGAVRYMVMGRTADSVADAMRRYPHRQFPFSAAIRLGINLMHMLRRLHLEAGVVHGDIHFGNVVFRDRETDELMFIDFGRSFSIPTSGAAAVSPAASPTVLSSSPPTAGGLRTPPIGVSPPDRIASAFEWTSYQMSPWEIAGYRPGPREDVYKALMMMTFMINGEHVLGYLKELDRNATSVNSTASARQAAVKTAYRFKMYEDMLVVPDGRYDVLGEKEASGRISRDQRVALSATFANVAQHIRQLGINAMPDYTYIIDQLTLMQAIYRDHPTESDMTGSGVWTRAPVMTETATPR